MAITINRGTKNPEVVKLVEGKMKSKPMDAPGYIRGMLQIKGDTATTRWLRSMLERANREIHGEKPKSKSKDSEVLGFRNS